MERVPDRIRIGVSVAVLGALVLAASSGAARHPALARTAAGKATAIAAGGGHTCAVTTAGAVKCWGYNSHGQVGDGTKTDRHAPVAVSGLGSGVAGVAAGGLHTCAITRTGGVACWGANHSGQLGDGTTDDRLAPVVVSDVGSGVTEIAAGASHTCALTGAGGVDCWGGNGNGQLGDGTTNDHHVPGGVQGLVGLAYAVAAGGAHSCAITGPQRTVVCWGANGQGQLGDGTGLDKHMPAYAQALGEAGVVAGDAHTCTFPTGGPYLACFGAGGHGQLGYGGTANFLSPIAVVAFMQGVLAVAAGGNHTCAITPAHGVECWGANDHGQLGDGTTTERHQPVAVSGLTSGVATIAAGFSHTCALRTTGTILCWGYNGQGQLGDGTTTDRLTPVPVLGFGAALPVVCVVPKVVGRALPKARKMIVKAHCRVGKVTRKTSSRRLQGRVLKQKPKPGRRLPKGARVNLTVGIAAKNV
ncbi:MAG TPA: PASTA domain-containing protein [Gaiellaceae bacterium]|nr:PASTA domain-containing protein [Gaiellaceae bacterium]